MTTTESNAAGAEVVVIGGGVEGCSIAWHLAKTGARVTLLERWEIASAASGASAGGVRHQGRDPREFPLAFRAIERWKSLEVELGADLSYRRQGHLTTIEHEEDLPGLVESTEAQIARGLDIRVIFPDELRSLSPSISRTVIAAAFSPNDGHANPAATTRAFAAAAARYGATIRTGGHVPSLVKTGGRIIGVETDKGAVAADVVVLAAGAWSKDLAETVGVELPIRADGFQAMTTKPAPRKLDQVIGSKRRLISLKQLPDGRYLLGGGWPGLFTLDFPRGRSLPESQTGNVEAAVGVFPPVALTAIEQAWLGIEAVATDEVPIIGPVDGIDGLVIAAGFSGHGFALSPAVGAAVATLITTGKIPVELADLTLARFGTSDRPEPFETQRVG